jgi:hypothetical protein
MSTTIKAQYGTGNQTIAITLTSLPNNNYRQSPYVDNSSSGPAIIYAYGSTDDNTSYSGGASGSDASYSTDASPPNLVYLGTVNVSSSAAVQSQPFSIARAFGGVVPKYWGIVVYNVTGGALDSSSSNLGAWYQGVQAQA